MELLNVTVHFFLRCCQPQPSDFAPGIQSFLRVRDSRRHQQLQSFSYSWIVSGISSFTTAASSIHELSAESAASQLQLQLFMNYQRNQQLHNCSFSYSWIVSGIRSFTTAASAIHELSAESAASQLQLHLFMNYQRNQQLHNGSFSYSWIISGISSFTTAASAIHEFFISLDDFILSCEGTNGAETAGGPLSWKLIFCWWFADFISSFGCRLIKYERS